MSSAPEVAPALPSCPGLAEAAAPLLSQGKLNTSLCNDAEHEGGGSEDDCRRADNSALYSISRSLAGVDLKVETISSQRLSASGCDRTLTLMEASAASPRGGETPTQATGLEKDSEGVEDEDEDELSSSSPL